ncbi:GTPase Era [Alicyclobacillus cycloheptanicus]|uniref:GTPase Era n=1 Tax=Alicyclobacillus cycloheptanicus TaxID=1457 RepID=A0ABT9XL59_9BACL|nr:GTPase Era [Alicyclobacillus cycloheptanicus]MDQ0190471.1 GTP-binding protein Era [Alicyclobacillus cycloheptanicus]WDM00765.1 GTPase Era [Alicyclobacillus cycloheptanicus]
MANGGKAPQKIKYRSGFAAIVGRPNVGKSTLLNALIGRKVAIMSNRPQTTRNRIHGVLTTDEAQLIFIDTPGLHKPHHKLGELMVTAAENALKEVDVVLVVCDATENRPDLDRPVIDRLRDVQTPVYLVINKVDAVPKPELLKFIDTYRTLYPFQEIVPVSARKGTQLEALKQLILEQMPEGPKYYPDDMVTDHPEQFIIAEVIREKVLHLTREEVPHSVMVEIEQLERRDPGGILYVGAVIYTERNSQKGILIGKRGAMLKQVGQLARQELEALLGSKIYMELWVKVKKDWRNEPGWLRRFGFEERD